MGHDQACTHFSGVLARVLDDKRLNGAGNGYEVAHAARLSSEGGRKRQVWLDARIWI